MRRQVMWVVLLGAFASHAEESAFGPGEQTDYEVSYFGLVAGRARISVGARTEEMGHSVWPLTCLGETTRMGGVWPIRDRFVSYWDPEAHLTVGSDFFVNENNKKRKERYAYDFAAMKAIVTRYPDGADPWQFDKDIEAGTVDLAAAGFNLRNAPLVPGAVHEIPVFTGHKLYRLKATVGARERLSLPLGDVEVHRVTITTDFNGTMKTTGGTMTLFYTADEKQLPVRAEAEFLFGTVRIDAVSYQPAWSQRGRQ